MLPFLASLGINMLPALAMMSDAIVRHGVQRHECGRPPRAPAARCLQHRPYGWQELHDHAANQSARYAVGEYPGRSPAGNAQYELYKQWCADHGQMSNAQYVLRYVQWHDYSALEPSLAPYLLDDGIEHWILWHHPVRTPGDTELDREREVRRAVELIARDGGVQLDPTLLVCFQNIPPLRSIPSIAHSHVFLRVSRMPPPAQRAVAEMRSAWRRRSPWLQASRASGAGAIAAASRRQSAATARRLGRRVRKDSWR